MCHIKQIHYLYINFAPKSKKMFWVCQKRQKEAWKEREKSRKKEKKMKAFILGRSVIDSYLPLIFCSLFVTISNLGIALDCVSSRYQIAQMNSNRLLSLSIKKCTRIWFFYIIYLFFFKFNYERNEVNCLSHLPPEYRLQ